MHNIHEWKSRTPEGDKREVRAVKFGGQWRFQSRLKGEEAWTYADAAVAPMEYLREFREILFRKYQRRRAAYEDVVLFDKLIADREASGDA